MSTIDDVMALIDEYAARVKIEPRRWKKAEEREMIRAAVESLAVRKPGVTSDGCSYVMPVDRICNKCRKIHGFSQPRKWERLTAEETSRLFRGMGNRSPIQRLTEVRLDVLVERLQDALIRKNGGE